MLSTQENGIKYGFMFGRPSLRTMNQFFIFITLSGPVFMKRLRVDLCVQHQYISIQKNVGKGLVFSAIRILFNCKVTSFVTGTEVYLLCFKDLGVSLLPAYMSMRQLHAAFTKARRGCQMP